jgi:predicted transcriptional regulator
MKSIKNLFKNEAVRKTLLFFDENPNCIDTVKGISLWIGGDTSAIQKALNQLVKEGVITSHATASTTAYAYTNNKEIVKNIEKYIKSFKGL